MKDASCSRFAHSTEVRNALMPASTVASVHTVHSVAFMPLYCSLLPRVLRVYCMGTDWVVVSLLTALFEPSGIGSGKLPWVGHSVGVGWVNVCSLCCDAACRLFPAAEADTAGGAAVCESLNVRPLSLTSQIRDLRIL